MNHQHVNTCWEFALKTITDFALVGEAENSIDWVMAVASVPVERDGEVFVEAIPNIKAEIVLELTVKKV